MMVSIIIPAKNEEKFIGKCLQSLQELDIPLGSYEVIVVDNGSQDKTVEIARGFQAHFFAVLEGTISKLRNFGASKTKGEILAFMDADCIVSKSWLKNALQVLSDPIIGATGSNYRAFEDDTWVAKAWEFNMREGKEGNHEVDWIQSGNLIIRRKVFEEVEGFSEDLSVCEDSDICYRIKERGYKVVSNENICSYHYGFCKTLLQFFRKEFWYGKDVLKLFLKHKEKKKYGKLLFFASFHLLCLLFLTGGIILHNGKIILASLAVMAATAFLLSLKIGLAKKKLSYLFPLTALYLLFGTARALCLLDFRNWRTK